MDCDTKKTLVFYLLRISNISKSIEFCWLLQLVSELLALVPKNLKWILKSIVCLRMICTRQGTRIEPPSIRGSKGKDIDNWQEEGPLDDIASHVPVISSQSRQGESVGVQKE